MRAVVLRSLAVVAIGAIVLAGVLYLASTVDGRAPSVVSITLTQSLPDEPTRALTTTSLEVAFTEPVEESSAVDALTIEPSVEGSVSWSGSTMIFTPLDPLELATGYTVTLDAGVRDLAGNTMTQLSDPFEFETAGRPDVVETVPIHGAEDVSRVDPITITFSTLMDTASVEASLDLHPAFAHELRWSGRLLVIVPSQPLDADREYEIRIGSGAFDVSGVALETPVALAFRTVTPGLEVTQLLPADGTDGISPTSPIAVIFDRGLDPDSVGDELLAITPAVAGSLELLDPRGEEPAEPSDARVLRFTPSGPLPANTTFTVELDSGIASLDGGPIAEPLTWSFTTGAPITTLSNQITFLSGRGGVPNLWTMNVDGTAARQLSSELTATLDYAIAPDGSSFVVGDGQRLVLISADGTDRRVLTEDGLLEFDPAYARDGQRIAFGRAEAETGAGLGIWERPADGGGASRVALPSEPATSPGATSSGEGDEEAADWRRAPGYSPDGESLGFVDPSGWVGIVELAGEVATRVRFDVRSPPMWLPDSSALLVTGGPAGADLRAAAYGDTVPPLVPGRGLVTGVLDRTSAAVEQTRFGSGAAVVAVAPDGRIAYLRDDGSLRISEGPDMAGSIPSGLADAEVAGVAFAPGENALVAVIGEAGSSDAATSGRIVRIDLAGGNQDVLTNDGWRPHWLP